MNRSKPPSRSHRALALQVEGRPRLTISWAIKAIRSFISTRTTCVLLCPPIPSHHLSRCRPQAGSMFHIDTPSRTATTRTSGGPTHTPRPRRPRFTAKKCAECPSSRSTQACSWDSWSRTKRRWSIFARASRRCPRPSSPSPSPHQSGLMTTTLTPAWRASPSRPRTKLAPMTMSARRGPRRRPSAARDQG